MSNAKAITLAEIPTHRNFDGYYWYSDQSKPTIIQNTQLSLHWFTNLPFIIEANFFTNGISIQVKYIDGVYSIIRFDLPIAYDHFYKEVTYIGHDLDGRNFKVIEAWEEVTDSHLENMKTLQPVWSAFAGFTL